MTPEQIEKIARDSWEEMGALVNEQGQLASEWQFFHKGIQIALSKYKFTERDVVKIHIQYIEKILKDYHIADDINNIKRIIDEYETQRKTSTQSPGEEK